MESSLVFSESTQTPHLFFNFLPQDWQEDIVPFWNDYSTTAKIFVLNKKLNIVGGGIVFSTVSPDTKAYQDLAQTYFDNGYLYLAFIYVDETMRGKNIGSLWLQKIIEHYPQQKFWLTIEDYSLRSFYEKNGFQLKEKISLNNYEEWVMVR